jgi:hypothetical protein
VEEATNNNISEVRYEYVFGDVTSIGRETLKRILLEIFLDKRKSVFIKKPHKAEHNDKAGSINLLYLSAWYITTYDPTWYIISNNRTGANTKTFHCSMYTTPNNKQYDNTVFKPV